MRLIHLIFACLAVMLSTLSAQAADGLFAPRVIVNDSTITNYEVEQRMMFLKALNAGGDLEKQSVNGLIEDRLRLQAAEAGNIEVTEKEILDGQTEFASRANLTAEEFVAELGKMGIEPETFREFVRAGIAWRNLVRDKFAAYNYVSDAAADRSVSATLQRGGLRVLLSELIIPAPPGQEADAMAQADELRATIGSQADFAAAAQQFSAASSAPQGGAIDWLPLGNLPPALRDMMIKMKPGEVTPPLPIPNAVGLFQLRGVEETGRPEVQMLELDYMQVLLPEGPDTGNQIARLRAGADRCDDLFGLTKGVLPPSQVIRTKQAAGEVPRDIGIELAKLDADESSVALRRGNARVFLMLCARNVAPPEENPPTRDQIKQRIANQQIAAASDNFLAKLRAAAVIREP
ncbi:MAG: peptidylprolyl isomerase [Cereibacter sphaeroides]|uniref:Parvulin-like PPIase n=1 Tax=Cereibacter sphaeroides TaxID=1063 RepID=A0A2W5SFH9_CERSP|nr:MAG: peptidylprolyl isomerase [Cereibacter sphaeroides]